MKKYTFAILSVMLCMTPLRAMAQVTAEYCASFTGDSCPKGCYSDFGSSEEFCKICPETTYSTTGLYCNACSKPKNAEFVTSSNGLYSGMEGPQECPWSIQVCDKNTYIPYLTSKDWNANTQITKSQCESCPFGKHADNTTQEWDGNALSDPCEPKKFYITINLNYSVTCEKTHTETFYVWTNGSSGYTFPTNTNNRKIIGIQEIMDSTKSRIDYNTYKFPSAGINTYTMKAESKPEGLKDIEIIIAKDSETNTSYLSFKSGTIGNPDDSLTNLATYPHEQQFILDINLERITAQRIYYCPSQITHQGALSGTCSNSIVYDACNQPTVAQYSDIASNFKIGQQKEQCANGKYSNSWIYITDLDEYNWENATEIKNNTKIILPEGANELYLAPVLNDCEQGTYNSTGICPTECEKCPDGFTSESGAASKNACFINVPLTDNTGSFSLEETVKVYYQGN